MLSMSLIEAGAHCCLATSLMKSTPGGNDVKTTDPYRRISGMGLMRMVTSVMIPRVPYHRKTHNIAHG